jgi:hypothetical protein
MTIGPMSAIGTSRHFAVVPNDGRDRSEADMPRASLLTRMTHCGHEWGKFAVMHTLTFLECDKGVVLGLRISP